MPEQSDGAKAGSKLALQTAIITALIGPLALIVVQHFLKPSVVQDTKDGISTVTVSDDRIRELCKSVVLLETPTRGRATGFLLSSHPRYVITSSSLFSQEGEPATVIRFKGYPDEVPNPGQVTHIEAGASLAFVDLGKKLSDGFTFSLEKSDVKIFDKLFTVGYARGDWPVLREGRIAVLDPRLMGEIGQRQRLDLPIRGYISADLPVERGMVGSPVFDKNSKVIGVLIGALTESNVAFIAPILQVSDLLDKIDNQH